MLIHSVLVPILIAAAPVAQDRPALHGTLRDRTGGEPIARVLVEVVGTPRHAWSDSLGVYELPVLEPGPQQIRFSRLGYEGLVVEVVLPTQGSMRLDAILRPRPIALSGVQLESGRVGKASPKSWRGEVSGPDIGTRKFTPGDRQLGFPVGEPDALWALSGASEVVLRPDLPTALHVRGGSADQNLVLLDGMPVLGAHHAGGVLSALPPDALGDVTLHSGVLPAGLGGALSSAIEVRTLEVPRQGLASRGGVGMRGVRATVAHALPGGLGGVLLAGRRSYRLGFPSGDEHREGGFADVLAKATLDLAGAEIDVLSFTSEDRLAFHASPEAEGDVVGDVELPLRSDPATAQSFNRFRWSSRTHGVAWRRAWTETVGAEVRAWHSGSGASFDWLAEEAPVRLTSARSQAGVAARIDAPFAAGSANAGLSLERLRVRYHVESLAAPEFPLPHDSLLTLESSAALLSAFFEEAWAAGERWSFRAGLRGQAGPGRGFLPEPRLSLSFAPSADVLLSAGYARTRQSVQSLRNEESILDAIAGIDLPVAAGMPGVPVARSDQLAAAFAARLGAGTKVEIDAYTRWLEGVVLVAPGTSQPFALTGFETGSGRASGATVLLEHQGARFTARAAYSRGTAVRQAHDVHYHTTFERPHSLSAAVDWRLARRTSVTAGLLAAAGAPTTPVGGQFVWEPFDPFAGEGELEGSPQQSMGALNEERLPSYVRLDAGIRQEWGASWLRDGAVLAAHLDILNLLDRQNAVGYALDPDTGARRPLTLLGRSLTFGLEWRY